MKAIRRGKLIPAGYILIGKTVTYKARQGGRRSFAELPESGRQAPEVFATTGHAGFASRQNYLNHCQAWVGEFQDPRWGRCRLRRLPIDEPSRQDGAPGAPIRAGPSIKLTGGRLGRSEPQPLPYLLTDEPMHPTERELVHA